jgi:hypothetical protein
MNYINDDYFLGHLLKQARATNINKLHIDILRNEIFPEQLITTPIRNSIQCRNKWFPSLVESSGSSMEYIKSAVMTIEFDLNDTRSNSILHNISENPFSCEMLIIDDRGKEYKYKHEGWWFPEP